MSNNCCYLRASCVIGPPVYRNARFLSIFKMVDDVMCFIAAISASFGQNFDINGRKSAKMDLRDFQIR